MTNDKWFNEMGRRAGFLRPWSDGSYRHTGRTLSALPHTDGSECRSGDPRSAAPAGLGAAFSVEANATGVLRSNGSNYVAGPSERVNAKNV